VSAARVELGAAAEELSGLGSVKVLAATGWKGGGSKLAKGKWHPCGRGGGE